MHKSNIRGFSLVEVVVATAVWSVVAMGIAYTVVSQKKDAITSERTNEAIDIANKLTDYVNSSAFCESVLSTTVGGNSRMILSTFSPLDIRDAKFTIGNITVSNGSALDANSNIRLIKARYRIKPGSAAQQKTITVGSKTVIRKIAQIELGLALFKGNENIKSLESRFIEVPVMTSGDYITSCELKVTEPEICNALGMSFDSISQVCDGSGDLGCDFMGSYTKADIDDNAADLSPACNGADEELINNVTGSCGCPSGTTEERPFGLASNTSKTVSCGKKCEYTVYSQYEVIGCFKCGGK
jgi:prepilin-type N-terminal cleavage/methylation domain-containing protein